MNHRVVADGIEGFFHDMATLSSCVLSYEGARGVMMYHRTLQKGLIFGRFVLGTRAEPSDFLKSHTE
jgi:hypothetical protein